VPCKLFLLLEGPNPSSSNSSSGNSGSTDSSSTNSSAAWAPGQHPSEAAGVAAPPGFAVKRFKLSMRKGLHLRLLLGQHPEEVEAAEEQPPAAAQPTSSQDVGGSRPGSSSGGMGEAQAGDEPCTVHMSQLPDAEPSQPQPLPMAAAPGAAAAAAPGGAGDAASAPASVWYLCKTVLKGLNSGSQEGSGAAQ